MTLTVEENTMYDEMYDMPEEEMIEMEEDQAFWQQVQDEEAQRWEEENDPQTLLDNDPGYHAWADAMDVLDREFQMDEDAHYDEMAAMEDERNFRTLQAWD